MRVVSSAFLQQAVDSESTRPRVNDNAATGFGEMIAQLLALSPAVPGQVQTRGEGSQAPNGGIEAISMGRAAGGLTGLASLTGISVDQMPWPGLDADGTGQVKAEASLTAISGMPTDYYGADGTGAFTGSISVEHGPGAAGMQHVELWSGHTELPGSDPDEAGSQYVQQTMLPKTGSQPGMNEPGLMHRVSVDEPKQQSSIRKALRQPVHTGARSPAGFVQRRVIELLDGMETRAEGAFPAALQEKGPAATDNTALDMAPAAVQGTAEDTMQGTGQAAIPGQELDPGLAKAGTDDATVYGMDRIKPGALKAADTDTDKGLEQIRGRTISRRKAESAQLTGQYEPVQEGRLAPESMADAAEEPAPRIQNMPDVAAVMARETRLMREGDQARLRVKLKPEQLGEIEIELRLKGGELSGEILVESIAAKDAFTSQIENLKGRLKEQNVFLKDLNISLQQGNNPSGRQTETGSHQTKQRAPMQHKGQTVFMQQTGIQSNSPHANHTGASLNLIA
ncbi:MAG TPA: flagellar hook-length control protein FliK [Candidatus Atribacteria bacterium]|nr:flagellar hook-length control protein FliK [Candidatus Atribacteria bacterium]